MVMKKLDSRIRTVIENAVNQNHRALFVVVGDKGRDQVVILHHILSKASVKPRPSVLWCYKKELGFSSHRKKRMRQLQKKMKGGNVNLGEDDPFELFIASTEIRYSYYSETHKILGNTYGMCVLQDFEAMTPNLLARTIETVEGGGIGVILLSTIASWRQLHTLTMDVHSRYRTEAHQDVVARFNERFLLSLPSCSSCVVLNDRLDILPISSQTLNVSPVPAKSKDAVSSSDSELSKLKETLQDTQPVGSLINCCKTLDQAKAVLKFLDVIMDKTLKSTIALTAARGRGKSAALGTAVAGAIAFMYSNIFVTSPSPENLKTFFEFVLKGFDVLEYQEHVDYEIIQSTNPDFNKAVIRINVFRDHRQTIQYIHPSDASKLGHAELLIIDEAAAIPLPLVKQLFGPYLVFMASTINGYEGTGRSLSMKLLQQLRQQSAPLSGDQKGAQKQAAANISGRSLQEMSLEESIRYSNGDSVEAWLNGLLCLDVANVPKLLSGCPPPKDCDLYYICRDTLFSYHPESERFLQRLMSIYVSAHYKNSPNDLQMISDAPAHHLFVLFGPINPAARKAPEILCVAQVCLEGEISKESVSQSLSRGRRAAGDLIPWTIAQQFQDNDFPSLSGARVVRIATHPDYQSMGYGSRTLELLQLYYEGMIPSLDEDNPLNGNQESINVVNEENLSSLEEQTPSPKKNLPPLFFKLSQRPPERLDYLGVSYGVTYNLLKFWKRGGYVPLYLRQTPNELTGEHSCIMLKLLNAQQQPDPGKNWLLTYYKDFRRRFVSLLSYQFSSFEPSLALGMVQHKSLPQDQVEVMSREELSLHVSNFDLKRLELYSQNLVDHHLITDLLPTIARFYFLQKIDIHLSVAQQAILLSLGLQHKSIDQVVESLGIPSGQAMALFNRTVRKIVQYLNGICERAIESEMMPAPRQQLVSAPLRKTLQDDLAEGAEEFQVSQAKKKALEEDDLSAYAISGKDEDWEESLKTGATPSIVSVKSSGEKSSKKKRFSSSSPDFKKKKQKKKGFSH